jgi:hypothetical protein
MSYSEVMSETLAFRLDRLHCELSEDKFGQRDERWRLVLDFLVFRQNTVASIFLEVDYYTYNSEATLQSL